MRRVAEVSELLVGDQPVDELLRNIVNTAQSVFGVPGVSLLELEDHGRLVVVASGRRTADAQRNCRQLDPHSGQPGACGHRRRGLERVAHDRPLPLGSTALSRSSPCAASRSPRPIGPLLNTFANDAALALERAELREQALRTALLEEADRFRRGLLGAVSHDLRTPLATIKVASSTLSTRAELLTVEDRTLLYRLVEIESDRLTRLVTNLLDVTRIEAGVLTPAPRVGAGASDS